MTLQEVKDKLLANRFVIANEGRLGNGTGTQLTLASGQKVNVFDNGTVNVQGKNADHVKGTLLGNLGEPNITQAGSPKNNRVFVVYGHDLASRTQLESMLLRWGLEPLILDQLPSQGQTIIEKLENLAGSVDFAVVLATPDDEGNRRDHPDEKACRARQNVVLELGMLLSKLGRSRVAILMKQDPAMERPSDIQGLIYIPFKDDVQKDAGLTLAKEMDAAGYTINLSKI